MRPVIFIVCMLLLSMNAGILSLMMNEGEDTSISSVRGEEERDPRTDGTAFMFDFGTDRSPLKNGYTRITPDDSYDEETSYGLLSSTRSYQVTSRMPEYSPHMLQRSWVYGEYANDLTMDGVRSTERVTFRTDLSNGTYRVRTWIGDLEKGVYSINISYNGEWLLEEADAFHPVFRSMYFTDDDYPDFINYGCAAPFTRDITVTEGSLVINVTGNDTSYWDALAIEQAKDPVYSYLSWMSTGTYKYSAGSGPWRYIGGPFTNASVLGVEIYPVPEMPVIGEVGSLELDGNVTDSDIMAAVDSINAGGWDDAYGSWEIATGKELAGEELVARAQVGLHLAGSISLNHEFDIIPQVERDLEQASLDDPRNMGILELRSSFDEFLAGLEYYIERGVPYPDGRTAKNHFYESNKGIAHLWRIEPDDPLYPKAQLWCARALYSLDPHRWTSASGTGRDILEALRPLDLDNPYITLYLDTTRELPRTWDNGTPVLSTLGEEDTWFLRNYTTGFTDAPEWAKILREELSWLYDITDWWVDHKQQADGSIGGGWTDDVEMIGLFGFDALISEGADEKSMEGARKFVEGMLASGQLDMEKGFSAAFADTEHTAELTGDSLPMMVATDFGNPFWIEFCMKTGVLMRDLWMGENDNGFLQFKANHLSATKVGTGGKAEDSWINFRAALPAFWVWWYSRDPEIEDLFVRWTECWLNASLSTEKGKPEGVTPAMIGWPDGEIGGTNAPSWYEGARNDGSVNYKWEGLSYKSYITTLFVSAFEATGNLSFLEPLRLEAELAQDYLDNNPRFPVEGSAEWAGMILGQKAINRYQDILDSYGLPGSAESPELWDPVSVVDSCTNGHKYIDKCYPLMTTEASATDRVAFVGIPNPFLIYTGGALGGALLSPSFTYTGLGRDFAAMVQSTSRSYGNISLYGFFDGVREAGLVPWALEPGATYELCGGPDADGDGIPDAGAYDYSYEFVFSSRGMEVPFNLTGRTLYALELEKLSDGTGWSLLPDPAFGADPVTVDIENGTVGVTIHNVGAADVGEFNVTLVAVDGNDTGTNVAWGRSDGMPAPRNLEPSTIEVDLDVTDPNASADYYLLIIDPGEGMDQITTRNDELRLELDDIDLSGVEPQENRPPTITITAPARGNSSANTSFSILWTASDPDRDTLTVSLFYDTDTDSSNGRTEIVSSIRNTGRFVWNTTELGEGEYYIFAEAEDEEGARVVAYSAGTVSISHGEGVEGDGADGDDAEDDFMDRIHLVFLVAVLIGLTILVFTVNVWYPKIGKNGK